MKCMIYSYPDISNKLREIGCIFVVFQMKSMHKLSVLNFEFTVFLFLLVHPKQKMN